MPGRARSRWTDVFVVNLLLFLGWVLSLMLLGAGIAPVEGLLLLALFILAGVFLSRCMLRRSGG